MFSVGFPVLTWAALYFWIAFTPERVFVECHVTAVESWVTFAMCWVGQMVVTGTAEVGGHTSLISTCFRWAFFMAPWLELWAWAFLVVFISVTIFSAAVQ